MLWLMLWLKYMAYAIGTLLVYEVVRFLIGFITANRIAHGTGYYRTEAPLYYMTGLVFIVFGLYLHFRH